MPRSRGCLCSARIAAGCWRARAARARRLGWQARCGRASLRRQCRTGSGAGSSPVRFGRCGEPASCRFGVAQGQSEEREQPARVAPHPRRALLEHDPRNVSEATGLTRCRRCGSRVARARRCRRLRALQPPGFRPRARSGPQAQPAPRRAARSAAACGRARFRTSGRPSPVGRAGGGKAVCCERECLLVSVGDTQQLAVPHVREPQALVVAGEDPVAISLGDQLVSSVRTGRRCIRARSPRHGA